MIVSDNLLRHVKSELEKLEYGSVTIEVVNGRSMDVITQVRKRFSKHECGDPTPDSSRSLAAERISRDG